MKNNLIKVSYSKFMFLITDNTSFYHISNRDNKYTISAGTINILITDTTYKLGNQNFILFSIDIVISFIIVILIGKPSN